MDRLINAKIDAALYEAVKQKCKLTGVSMAFKVREALEKWVNEDQPTNGSQSPATTRETVIDRNYNTGA